MATRTPNLSLIKPGPDDAVDVADLNENFDKLDNFAGGVGGDTYTKAEVDTMLAEKVNTEEGKGLSSNDFTDSEKAQILANKAGIGAVANRGSKNQLDVSQTPSTMNAGNITITKGTDGSLTLNGTSTAASDVIIGRITLPAGDYVLSGCAEGGSGGTWLIRIYGEPVITNTSNTVGTVFHTDGITNATVRIVVGNNKTLTDAVFKPMICTKAEWDISQEFVLYAPTNRELYEAIDNINSELSVPVISSSTSLTDYANTLSRGYHTAFFTSASKPSDAPISDNCFVEIFVYSGSTAIMRVIPTGTAHYANNYVKTKVSGTWQTGWVVYAGTAQSGT